MSLLLLPLFLLTTTVTLSTPTPSCNSTHKDLLSKAFNYVENFDISTLPCNPTELKLPSSNLFGDVSWQHLSQLTTLVTIDLSNNNLNGHIPRKFWPSLLHLDLANNRLGGSVGLDVDYHSNLKFLNISRNRFTNVENLSGFSGLLVLDMSWNNLKSVPVGIKSMKNLTRLYLSNCNMSGTTKDVTELTSLEYFDVSGNALKGLFPQDFPVVSNLKFLNISFNKFTGLVEPAVCEKFGRSSFQNSGAILPPAHHKPNPESKPHRPLKPESAGVEVRKRRRLDKKVVVGVGIGGVGVVGLGLVGWVWVCRRRRRERKRKDGWRFGGVEGGAVAVGCVAPVVMFEKPLMELTYSDVVAATAGFGKESLLAEGKETGPVYMAVLPGDIHVAVKVLEKAEEMEGAEAKSLFHELASTKHPNLLPLLGYCIAGKQKLLLHHYMHAGDLRRWLHELPPSDDATSSWPIRHRILLGVARGLAFLHDQTRFVHARLDPASVLLADDLDPKIAGVGIPGVAGGTKEEDVLGFGRVLAEVMTGRVGSGETVGWVRGLVKEGNGLSGLDGRIRIGSDEEEREMEEVFRVLYLCTAEVPQKRPSMRQVVGLLKDIRPSTV